MERSSKTDKNDADEPDDFSEEDGPSTTEIKPSLANPGVEPRDAVQDDYRALKEQQTALKTLQVRHLRKK